jgi:lipoprotein-anchoring transpeptidase ErfK/SrfK
MLTKYGEADKAGPFYRKIGKFISKLNMKIIGSGLTDEKMVVYRVNIGDNLTNIAIKYNFPVDAIQKANNLKTTTIYPGKSLKVYQFDWRIEVSKKAKLLYVYDGDNLFAMYDIGIGKEGRTPEGEFKITDKIANPDWYAPDGRIVAFGDKENVLGTRWLKLDPINNTDAFHIGYGIHGTWDTGSITQSLSNGCIRMRNEEVEELFTYIPRQVFVKIY